MLWFVQPLVMFMYKENIFVFQSAMLKDMGQFGLRSKIVFSPKTKIVQSCTIVIIQHIL